MQRLDVSGTVRPIYESLGVKRLTVSLTLRPIYPKQNAPETIFYETMQ